MAPEPAAALLALLTYQNLCVAESLNTRADGSAELSERLVVARLGSEALNRFTRACDAIPGGQGAAVAAMEPFVSAVDEFWSMTRPRVAAEQRLRVMVVASLELELLQRLGEHLPDTVREALEPSAGLWRAVDHGAQSTVQASAGRGYGVDELSLYARRLLGEAAVMAQRVLLRQEALRQAVVGGSEVASMDSSAVLDEVLAAVAARVGQLGLSV